MNLSVFIKTGLALLALSSIVISTLNAQECKTTEDLLHTQGILKDHKKTPIQGFVDDFTAAEKSVALKTLNNMESYTIRNFTIQGGHAEAWFNFNEFYYFDTYLHKSYKYKIGFYPFVCVNGIQKNGSEYISDFEITANPSIHYYFKIPSEFESSNSYFDAIHKQKSGPQIAAFRYLVFPNANIASTISNGNGYYENDFGDEYNNRRDIYRIWYITNRDKKLLTEVSRKEYLNNLLEYYEREKLLLFDRNDRKIADAKKYITEYEKSGNKVLVKSHLEDQETALNERALLTNRYTTKKQKVLTILSSKSDEWLQQAARINPEMRDNGYCDNSHDFQQWGYFTFTGFCENDKAVNVYKWNSEYFKIQLQSPTEPLFFKVSFRYKANTPFTLQIKDNFIEQFDVEPLHKFLSTK